MQTIWKGVFPINAVTVSFTTVLRMPSGSKFIHLAEQHGDIAMWFEVDDNLPALEERKFQIFGTGTGPIGSHLAYRGTILMHNGELVLHVYEVVGVVLTVKEDDS